MDWADHWNQVRQFYLAGRFPQLRRLPSARLTSILRREPIGPATGRMPAIHRPLPREECEQHTMRDELLDAWRTNHRINLYLIRHISDDGLQSTLSARGGRDVARQFGHIHTNRVWQLEKRAPDLAHDLVKFEGKDSPDREELIAAHEASSLAMEAFLTGVLEGERKRRGFKRGIFTTLGYFIAHESHHRGNILLTLKMSGHGVPKDVAYAIWGWDRI